MSPIGRVAAVLLLSVCSWLLLGWWCPQGSERFYLVFPVALMAVFLAAAPPKLAQLRPHLLPATLYLLGLFAFCVAYGCFVGRPALLFTPRLSMEVLLAFYFLIGMTLLLLAVRAVVRRACLRLVYFGPESSWRHVVFVQLLAPLLAGALFLPWLMAAIYSHPFKLPNWTSPERPFENVQFTTADGLTIRGWFIPAPKPAARTLLICHGLAANRSVFLPFASLGERLDANVLLFDFRGHGDSDGHTVTLGWNEKHDVLAALEYLRTRKPGQARQVIGLGVSMGSAALLHAAAEAELPFDAVIVDSGFASVVELTDRILCAVPGMVRPCLTAPGIPYARLHTGCWLPEVRPEKWVAAVRAPLLVVHARDDFLIPPEHARRLFAEAREPKTLLIAESGNHAGSLFTHTDQYLNALKRLLEQSAHRRVSETHS